MYFAYHFLTNNKPLSFPEVFAGLIHYFLEILSTIEFRRVHKYRTGRAEGLMTYEALVLNASFINLDIIFSLLISSLAIRYQ